MYNKRFWTLIIIIMISYLFAVGDYHISSRTIIEKDFVNISQTDNPIFIDEDQDFVTLGFTGNGTSSNPFLIEDLSIIFVDVPTSDSCIIIANITKHFLIQNCYLEEGYEGIKLVNISTSTSRIENNTFDGCRTGVYVEQSNQVYLENNKMIYCAYGVDIQQSENAKVANNHFLHGSYGVNIENSDAYVDSNMFEFITNGIRSRYSSDCIIKNNTIVTDEFRKVEHGISFYYGNNIQILQNYIAFHDYDAIDLTHVNNSIISENEFLNNSHGIDLSFGSNMTIRHNALYGENQIDLYECTKVEVSNNTIEYSFYSIRLSVTHNSIIKNNTLYRNIVGISLENSNYIMIEYNLIQETNNYGCRIIYGSDHNIIHHNTFVLNAKRGEQQANDDGFNNTFYDRQANEGNFWDDWKGWGKYKLDGTSKNSDPHPLDGPTLVPREYMGGGTNGFVIGLVSILSLFSLSYIYSKRKKTVN